MKKIFFALAALAAMTACDDNTPAQKTPIEGMVFVGTTMVTTIESGAVFTAEDTRFELDEQEDGTVRLLMHETKFAEQMPAMDMEVPGIIRTGKTLAAESTIPEIAGTPYPRYIMTGLSGTVGKSSLEIECICAGAYEIAYTGVLTEE